MYIGLHVKYLLVMPEFNKTWIFSTDFRQKKNKPLKYQFLWKSIQLEPNFSIRKDGRTDIHDEGNSRFS